MTTIISDTLLGESPPASVQSSVLKKIIDALFKKNGAYFADWISPQEWLYVTLDKMIVS